MTKINIINKKTISRKLKRYFKLGLIGVLIYGGIHIKPGINDLLDKRESKRELRRSFTKKDYTESYKLLNNLKQEDIFSSEKIQGFDKKLQDIHPMALVEIADSTEATDEKAELYYIADREFRELGQEKEALDLKDKIIHSSIKDLENIDDRKREPLEELDEFMSYLSSNNNFPLSTKQVDEFFEFYNKFLENNILGNNIWTQTKDYINKLDSLANKINIENKGDKMRESSSYIANFYFDRITRENPLIDSDLGNLENIVEMTQKYNPEDLGNVIRFYLNAQKGMPNKEYLSKGFLDAALFHSEKLLKNNKNNLKEEIATNYVDLSKQVSKEDIQEAYSLLQTAKGIYYGVGIKSSDKRFAEIDSLQNVFNKKI